MESCHTDQKSSPKPNSSTPNSSSKFAHILLELKREEPNAHFESFFNGLRNSNRMKEENSVIVSQPSDDDFVGYKFDDVDISRSNYSSKSFDDERVSLIFLFNVASINCVDIFRRWSLKALCKTHL